MRAISLAKKNSLRQRKWWIVVPLLLLLVTELILVSQARLQASDDNGNENYTIANAHYYIYLNDEMNSTFPVREYLPSTRLAKRKNDRPPFLYDSDYPYPRLVVFYAHWCPHCQHYKPKFIESARKIEEHLRLKNVSTKVEWFAVSCVPHQHLCNHLMIDTYPQVKFYPAMSNHSDILSSREMQPAAILKRLQKKSAESSIASTQADASANGTLKQPSGFDENNVIHNNDNTNLYFMDRTNDQVLHDAYASLEFALRTAIFASEGSLPEPRNQAFRNWIHLLQVSLLPIDLFQPLVQDLTQQLDRITESEKVLIDLVNHHSKAAGIDTKQPWSPACVQHGTGYTCGLWQLFHIITIGMVEYYTSSSSPNRPSTNRHAVDGTPMAVADTIRAFVDYFFQCQECREHFLHDYESCGQDRCSRLVTSSTRQSNEWIQLPLWLYETHNAVNVRLQRERKERGEVDGTTRSDDVLWPPKSKCPRCWSSTTTTTTPNKDQQKFPLSKDDIMYKYLRLTYW